jgi:hypothetical protein
MSESKTIILSESQIETIVEALYIYKADIKKLLEEHPNQLSEKMKAYNRKNIHVIESEILPILEPDDDF